MKKYLFGFAMGCLTLLMASCNIESSDNGDLDGLWQLASVDTLTTGGHADLRGSNVAWAFQGKLLELKRAEVWYVCKFTHADGMLTLGTLFYVDRNQEDPEVKEDSEVKDGEEERSKLSALQPYGINALEESFKVITLKSGTMVLESTMLRLNFRKY